MSLTPYHIGTDKIYKDWCRSVPPDNIPACEVKHNPIVSLKYRKLCHHYEVIYKREDGVEYFEYLSKEEFEDKIKVYL